jgi:dihydropyrimidine dehydrogenase (NAD+) subunit PreT
VRCQRLDTNKKPIPGAEVTLDADLVLVAIGQSKLGTLLSQSLGASPSTAVASSTDEHGATGRKGWYAGGDCRNGGKEVVNAAAEGKAAARAPFICHGSM